MATILYGTIVTSISGSVGGNTFKKNRYSNILSMKSRGGSRSKLISNPSLAKLSFVLRGWKYLSAAVKLQWSTLASSYPVIDNFGLPVVLSGRNMYNRAAGALYIATDTMPDIDNFDGIISNLSLSNFHITLSTNIAEVNLSNISANNYFLLQMECSSGKLAAPIFDRKKIVQIELNNIDFTMNIIAALFERFPYVAIGYSVRLYITPLSLSGIKGVTQIIQTKVF